MKKFFTISILICFFAACKKEKSVTPVVANTGTPYSISTDTAFYGIFSSVSYTQETGSNIFHNNSSGAYFTNTPISYYTQGNYILISDISLNDVRMNCDSALKIYNTPSPANIGPQVWKVTGNSTIPSFTFSNINNDPSFSDFNIPDTIHISSGATITLQGISDLMSAGQDLIITDDSFTTQVNRTLQNGNNVLTFSPSELSVFAWNPQVLVFFSLQNIKKINIEGKAFYFKKEKLFSKYVVIRP